MFHYQISDQMESLVLMICRNGHTRRATLSQLVKISDMENQIYHTDSSLLNPLQVIYYVKIIVKLECDGLLGHGAMRAIFTSSHTKVGLARQSANQD